MSRNLAGVWSLKNQIKIIIIMYLLEKSWYIFRSFERLAYPIRRLILFDYYHFKITVNLSVRCSTSACTWASCWWGLRTGSYSCLSCSAISVSFIIVWRRQKKLKTSSYLSFPSYKKVRNYVFEIHDKKREIYYFVLTSPPLRSFMFEYLVIIDSFANEEQYGREKCDK